MHECENYHCGGNSVCMCVCEREKCVGVCMHVAQEIILIILIRGGYD